ncbi:MAG TPA: hypothetical protein VF556_01950 [Pyrinomonadaceae bacterium]|jgi:hypothetical protein
MFTLIQSSPLEITLDPVSTEERLSSVAFDITAKWTMPYQNAQIVVKECWFEYSELNNFEVELKQLINRQIDDLKFNNMSLEPIMVFRRNNEKFSFEFLAIDSSNIGIASIKTNLFEQELIEITQNVRNWSKWW